MQILAIERELTIPPHANLPELLREEAACVWALQKEGVIREIWFTGAEPRAVVLLECASAAAARDHLASLPLVRHGLIDFTLHPLRSYDGFERLLGSARSGPAPAREEPAEY